MSERERGLPDVPTIDLDDQPWEPADKPWWMRVLHLSWTYVDEIDRVCGPEYRMALEGRAMT